MGTIPHTDTQQQTLLSIPTFSKIELCVWAVTLGTAATAGQPLTDTTAITTQQYSTVQYQSVSIVRNFSAVCCSVRFLQKEHEVRKLVHNALILKKPWWLK